MRTKLRLISIALCANKPRVFSAFLFASSQPPGIGLTQGWPVSTWVPLKIWKQICRQQGCSLAKGWNGQARKNFVLKMLMDYAEEATNGQRIQWRKSRRGETCGSGGLIVDGTPADVDEVGGEWSYEYLTQSWKEGMSGGHRPGSHSHFATACLWLHALYWISLSLNFLYHKVELKISTT